MCDDCGWTAVKRQEKDFFPEKFWNFSDFEEAEVGGVCPETVGHVDASSRLGIDSVISWRVTEF